MMPFITEEIWQSVAPLAGAHRSRRSCCSPTRRYGVSAGRGGRAQRSLPIKAAILGARQIRGQLDIPQSREIVIHYQSPHEDDQHSLTASLGVVKAVGRISELQIVAVGAQLPPSATRQHRAAHDLLAARRADR